ncbi:hypothetical protein Daesc_009887 [Daldinia eschscholtzii]|uniref:Uncharacterized protein n=1 Tax=Daldinia eschscholtzii TaxID=292717 RepID=A0AAX6M6S1_9PEZI
MPTTEQAFIREVWGLQGTAYLVVALRYYSRFSIMGWHSLAWDDAIMFLAVVVHTAESAMAYLVVAYWKGLANNAMTDAQRAALDPSSEEWYLRVSGSKTHVVGLILYTTLLWLLKASFLKCVPFERQWQINPSPGNNCMPAISTVQTIFLGDIDPAQSGYWSVRESFVSVVLTNMPMVYPIFRRFIEKGLSASRSKVTSEGDSRGYKLSSLPGRAAAVGRNQKPSAPEANDTAWDSEEHIMSGRGQGHSIGDEDGSSNLSKHHAIGAAFHESGSSGRAPKPTDGSHQIMVTTEYTVTEGSRRGSKNLGKPGFLE